MPSKKQTRDNFSRVLSLGPNGTARLSAFLTKNKLPLNANQLGTLAMHNQGRLNTKLLAQVGVANPEHAHELMDMLPGVHRLDNDNNENPGMEVDLTFDEDFLKENAFRPTPRPGPGIPLSKEELEKLNPLSPLAQLRPIPTTSSDMVKIGEAMVKSIFHIPNPGDIPTLIRK